MKRKITLSGAEYTADFGGLETARVTIHGGTVTVSPNLDLRTPGADFEDDRSEERRVGKECRSRWSPYH